MSVPDLAQNSLEILSTENPRENKSRGITVYKIEGYHPSPFLFKICRDENIEGKVVTEFTVGIFPPKNRAQAFEAPAVFPKMDKGEWKNKMDTVWSRPVEGDDKDKEPSDEASGI